MINFQAERLRRLPQRPGEIWQGGITRLPLWVRADEEGLPDPVRSWAAGWVSLQTRAVFLSDGYTETSGQAEALLDALVDLAYDKKQAGYRPGKVQVCEPLLAESLRTQLEGSGITVELTARSFILERTLTDAAEATRPYLPMPCGPMDAEGVTVEMMRAYATAAAELYRARPWELLDNDDLIVLESPVPDEVLKHICVLGARGEFTGLCFHESPKTLQECSVNQGSQWMMPGRHWHLRFDPIDGISYGDVDLWERFDLPVAGPNAYPFAVCYETKGPYRRPGPMELAFFEGFMRALAQSTEQDFDSGRWTRRVDTFDEPMEFAFTLPDVLAPRSRGTRICRWPVPWSWTASRPRATGCWPARTSRRGKSTRPSCRPTSAARQSRSSCPRPRWRRPRTSCSGPTASKDAGRSTWPARRWR